MTNSTKIWKTARLVRSVVKMMNTLYFIPLPKMAHIQVDR